MREEATFRVKSGLAEMLKGGVIMDVTDAEQARIAEDAGACAVMALERVPADIRAQGGVARMANTAKIREIQEAVTIPVMAKARIGHFVEAQVLEALEVDYVDESEVLTPADEANHIDKWRFKVPFVCGATDLGEALRRISEGAAMIRTKGEAGTGNVVEAVRHMRAIQSGIRRLASMDEAELPSAAKDFRAPFDFRELDAKTKAYVPVTDEKKVLEIGREISPINHATSDDPPTLIIHGDADKLVPIQQAQILVKKLNDAGVEAKLVTKPGAAHGWADQAKDMVLIADWFDAHLKKSGQ